MAIRIVNGMSVEELANVIDEHDGSIVNLSATVISHTNLLETIALKLGLIPSDLLVNGVIKSDYRPISLLDDGLVDKGTDEAPILGFDYDSEVFIAAVQAASGGTVLPTAPALTGVTDDDVNNIRTVVPDTDNGYTPSDVETSVDNGVTAATHTTNDFQIGNVALGIGVVKSRYKAIAGVRKAGPWFSNTVAYTASGTGGGNLIPVTQWIEYRGFVPSSNNLIPNGSGNNRARSQQYIPAGAIGFVQWGGDAAIALDDHPEDITYGNGTDLNFVAYRSSVGNKISTRVGTTYADYAALNTGASLRFNLTDASTIVLQSQDAGSTTWVDRATFARTPGVDLYVKADQGYQDGDSVTNILTSGFSINTTLS